jgi:hypothetical protein
MEVQMEEQEKARQEAATKQLANATHLVPKKTPTIYTPGVATPRDAMKRTPLRYGL